MPPLGEGEIADINIEEPVPEPEYEAISNTEKEIELKVHAIADYVKYEIEKKEILFKPTMMYTTRKHSFKVRNTSLISAKYMCKLVSTENA